MFVEMTLEAWEKFKKKLEEKGYKDYEVSDCTMPNDSIKHVHIDFGKLSKDIIKKLAKDLDISYEEIAMESKTSEIKEVRTKKWDESYHMPGKEAKAFITGENMEEEVTYERT